MTFPIEIPLWAYPLIALTLIWKAIGLWYSARDKHLAWFIFILIFNTLGILPIIYLLYFRKKFPVKSFKKPKKKTKKKSNNDKCIYLYKIHCN